MAKDNIISQSTFGTGDWGADLTGKVLGTDAARKAAAEQFEAANKAADLQEEHANRLWGDTLGLRSLRDSSLGTVNNLMSGDRSSFYQSPEYTQTRDAGVGTLGIGDAGGLNNKMIGANRLLSLQGDAGESALDNYDNYYGRQAQAAGITSAGLNNTNAQMQQATNAQAELLQSAADSTAAGLMGASNQAKSNAAGIGGIMAGIFSDERLKENVQFTHNANGHRWYTWEWAPDAAAIVGDQVAAGVIAQEVQKTRPDAVTEHHSGYLVVDYGRL